MAKSELEQMAYKDDNGPSTDKIERGAALALFKFGLHTLADTIDKIAKIAERIDQRHEQAIDAEVQSLSARANTLKTKMQGK